MSREQEKFKGIDSETALSIFMAAPTPYLILDTNFTIIDSNECRLKVTNTTREGTIGRNLFGVFPDNPDDQNADGVSNLRASLETVLKTKAPHRMNVQKYDIPNPSQEGKFEERYWSPLNFPVLDSRGEVKYIIHQVEDITEEMKSKKHAKNVEEITKAIKLERTRLLSIFNQAPIGISFLKGPELIFEFANHAYRKIVGEKRILDGLPLARAFPDIDPKSLFNSYHTYKTGKTEIKEDFRVTADWDMTGKSYEKIFFIIWEPVIDSKGNTEGVITLVYDDTENIRARLEARTYLHDLQRERDLRERFVTTLTHDLRTPLTAVKMSVELLARRPDNVDTVLMLSEKIKNSLHRCDQMIVNLLDANRIKAGQKLALEKCECSMKKIIEQTIDELTTVHGDRFQLIAPQGPVEGIWSCNGIVRIVENLCNNAIKYGSKVEKILVTIDELIDTVSIRVLNRGSVISPEDQKHLFDLYSRAGSGSEGDVNGWGLGLTLVKGITEAHDGTVTVQSSHEGTIFEVRLPKCSS